ncbi:type VII secretion target [Streptomyces sp. HNM0574]|uniref:type VII secretion target n=1 Tax=Streptomyces sp. HNM0574 TaxID=2714954 RepID=UPI00146CE433|nr:type VII secretion target [Streptomyces sp. HNM0574]NLU69170.1 hypothetical protein [Streptomyces sp. HNM0574]
MSSAGAGGYEVQKGGMAEEAGRLDRAGDDVGRIRKAVEDEACYTPETLGGPDSGPAYERFSAAWQAEARTLEAALHELADKVRVSSRNYAGADDDARAGLRAASGDGLTTMPAPGPGPGSGITTGPAPGERPAALGDTPPVGTRPTPGTPPPGLADFD